MQRALCTPGRITVTVQRALCTYVGKGHPVQANDSKQTVPEPWNQYMYRDEQIRSNLQVGEKAPKVLGVPRAAGFCLFKRDPPRGLSRLSETLRGFRGWPVATPRAEGGRGEVNLPPHFKVF